VNIVTDNNPRRVTVF